MLIGTDDGEWGGSLCFQKNETSVVDTLALGNINSIFYFNKEIFYIDGLVHLSNNGGSLFKLKRENNKFHTNKILYFDDAPKAAVATNERIYIATYGNLYVVENSKKIKVFDKNVWSGFYPNSVAVYNNENIFVGMRAGFARINIKTKEIKFYKPY